MENENLRLSRSRQSSFELLKIVAMLLVIISHSMPTKISGETSSLNFILDLGEATNNPQIMLLVLFRYCGQIGNAIFVASSAWFLQNSRKIKLERVISIILDTCVISILYFILFLPAIKTNFETLDVIKSLFPITFELYWFIGCYIGLYLIHPYLNLVTNSIQRKEHFLIVIVLFLLYCIVDTGINKSYYFYTNFIGFICVYLFTSYYKKYLYSTLYKTSLLTLTIGIAIVIFQVLILEILGNNIHFFSKKCLYWSRFMNPGIIMIALSSVGIVAKSKLNNKIVNYWGGKTLYLYLIHENFYLRRLIKRNYFRFIFNSFTYHHILLWVLLYFVALVVYSFLLSAVYEWAVGKRVSNISIKLKKILESLLSKNFAINN